MYTILKFVRRWYNYTRNEEYVWLKSAVKRRAFYI